MIEFIIWEIIIINFGLTMFLLWAVGTLTDSLEHTMDVVISILNKDKHNELI